MLHKIIISYKTVKKTSILSNPCYDQRNRKTSYHKDDYLSRIMYGERDSQCRHSVEVDSHGHYGLTASKREIIIAAVLVTALIEKNCEDHGLKSR